MLFPYHSVKCQYSYHQQHDMHRLSLMEIAVAGGISLPALAWISEQRWQATASGSESEEGLLVWV